MNDIGKPRGYEGSNGWVWYRDFFFFPYCLILFWSILLLGYVWVRTFFFTFLRPLTATFVRVRVRVRVGLSVSVKVGMPTYLNPFLESWVISTCSTERNLFFLPFFVFLSTCSSLTGWVLQSNYFDQVSFTRCWYFFVWLVSLVCRINPDSRSGFKAESSSIGWYKLIGY